jgi:hypothetical protein
MDKIKLGIISLGSILFIEAFKVRLHVLCEKPAEVRVDFLPYPDIMLLNEPESGTFETVCRGWGICH